MGGQIASEGSLFVDMRGLDRMVAFAPAERRITVQTGITWRKIQEAIDPHGLAVKIMQSYANFTVGGSLSVNAHGRYVGEGPLINSVESIAVVLANGELLRASRTENPELFFGAIGGYGGLGVIVEATLDLVENRKVAREVTVIGPRAWAGPGDAGRIVYVWEILKRPGDQRTAIAVPVGRLDEIIPRLERDRMTVDHLYDY